MNPDSTQSPYGLWKVDTHPAVIEYSNSAMSAIAVFAADGLQRLARGGIEVGGVLFGTRNGTALRIEAWRPILCEHSRGPSFLLSKKDEAALDRLLNQSESDPELKGYEALGWFHSHTRSEICLTDEDLQIYDRFFAELWQVALVVKPKRLQNVRAGFFVRELGGILRTASSFFEFSIQPTKSAAPPRQAGPVIMSNEQPAPATPPIRRERRVRSPFTSKWLIAIALVLMILTGARLAIMNRAQERPTFLPIKISDQFGTLQIEWDRDLKEVTAADSAEILIADGKNQVKKNLDAQMVHNGIFHYMRSNEDVRIELTLFRGDKAIAKEVSLFVGQKSLRGKDAVLEKASSQIQEVTDENIRLKQALKKETARSQRLERAVRTLQDRLAGQQQ